jgi:hypothetical protein
MSGYNVTIGSTSTNVTVGYRPTLGVTQQASGIVGPAGPGIGTTSSINTTGIITASYFVGGDVKVSGVLEFIDGNIRIGDVSTGSSIANTVNNIFIGVGAGYANTNGYANNFIGYQAGYANTDGYYNNFIGHQAGTNNTSGNNNNFIGAGAGYTNTSGYANNFFGGGAGFENTTGTFNNFFGYAAGSKNTTGIFNNFFGYYAGVANITGTNNIYLGNISGISTSASNKIIVGSGLNNNYLFDSPDTTKDNQFAIGIRTDNNPSKYWLVGNESYNIGIGTTNPTSKLHVVGDSLVTGITTVGLGTTSTPPSNSQMSFELISNTNLRIKVRGTDGVLRSANITLA